GWDEMRDLVRDLVPAGQVEPPTDRTIPYEQWDWRPGGTAGARLRLIEHVRTLYRPYDLGASANNDDPLALLPLGDVERLALPGQSYKLAFTAGLLGGVYGAERLSGSVLEAEGGYVRSSSGGDAGVDSWWVPSGRVFYSPGSTDTAVQELA